MKKVTVILLLSMLFLVSCGEVAEDSSLDISSVSSAENDISEDSYVFEESSIDTSSSGEGSSSAEEDYCRISYGFDTETAKVFEIS